jgi:hypothetical protein
MGGSFFPIPFKKSFSCPEKFSMTALIGDAKVLR